LVTSKSDFLSHSLNSFRLHVLNSLKDPEVFLKKHVSRQEEFVMTRCQAAELYKSLTGKNCYYFPNLQDRSPHFPSDVIGSFSHSQDHVCTIMGLQNKMRTVGIDIETLGRFKPKMSEVIQNERDLKTCAFLTDDQLGTLIFSAKESFFKLPNFCNNFFLK
jgi:enterobactin synthetase component D